MMITIEQISERVVDTDKRLYSIIAGYTRQYFACVDWKNGANAVIETSCIQWQPLINRVWWMFATAYKMRHLPHCDYWEDYDINERISYWDLSYRLERYKQAKNNDGSFRGRSKRQIRH